MSRKTIGEKKVMKAITIRPSTINLMKEAGIKNDSTYIESLIITAIGKTEELDYQSKQDMFYMLQLNDEVKSLQLEEKRIYAEIEVKLKILNDLKEGLKGKGVFKGEQPIIKD